MVNFFTHPVANRQLKMVGTLVFRIKRLSMGLDGRDCGNNLGIIPSPRQWSSKAYNRCVSLLSVVVHMEFWCDRSLWNEFMAVFRQMDPVGWRCLCATLERDI